MRIKSSLAALAGGIILIGAVALVGLPASAYHEPMPVGKVSQVYPPPPGATPFPVIAIHTEMENVAIGYIPPDELKIWGYGTPEYRGNIAVIVMWQGVAKPDDQRTLEYALDAAVRIGRYTMQAYPQTPLLIKIVPNDYPYPAFLDEGKYSGWYSHSKGEVTIREKAAESYKTIAHELAHYYASHEGAVEFLARYAYSGFYNVDRIGSISGSYEPLAKPFVDFHQALPASQFRLGFITFLNSVKWEAGKRKHHLEYRLPQLCVFMTWHDNDPGHIVAASTWAYRKHCPTEVVAQFPP